MPNRIIKESVCTSETIDKMSWFEECFYTRLWTACDDYGRMDARPAILKSKLFPLKDRLSLKDVNDALYKLADIGCVRLYECDSKPYLYLPAWEVHQSIRAKKSKYPAPESDCGNLKSSASICKQMNTDDSKCSRNPIQSESESNPPKAPQGGPPPQPLQTGFEPVLQEAFEEWLSYKRERRETYKPTGLQSLVTQIRKAAGEYGAGAVASLIQQSMANGYRGIVFDRLSRSAPLSGDKAAHQGSPGSAFPDYTNREGSL